MALLSLVDIRKSFGGLNAVSEVSFSVGEGEIAGLIGPNGAGKTTLFHIVTSIFPPSGGRVLFCGEDLAGQRPHDITRKGICRTFQNIRLFPRMTARENVMVGRHARSRAGIWRSVFRTGVQRAEEAHIREKTDELLAFMGLAGYEESPAGKLPYGHQRRLEIARALAAEPRLLLLDEPSLGLAPFVVSDIFRILREINAEGTTVLLVEQNARQALKASRYAYVLETGRIAHQGTSGELRNDPKIKEAYLGGRQ